MYKVHLCFLVVCFKCATVFGPLSFFFLSYLSFGHLSLLPSFSCSSSSSYSLENKSGGRKMSYTGGAMSSPGNVAVHHGSCNAKVMERRVKIAELVLRVLILGLGVLAAALIGFDSEVKVIFSITKKAKFTDMKALVFLVIADGIVATYSLLQVVRCLVGMIRGSILFSKPLAWAIFSGDQMMAYLTLAAVATAAQSSVLGKFGQTELQWMKTCDLYKKFCNQVGEGFASSVVVSLCTVILSCISAYSLFRLYGGSKRKSSATW